MGTFDAALADEEARLAIDEAIREAKGLRLGGRRRRVAWVRLSALWCAAISLGFLAAGALMRSSALLLLFLNVGLLASGLAFVCAFDALPAQPLVEQADGFGC